MKRGAKKERSQKNRIHIRVNRSKPNLNRREVFNGRDFLRRDYLGYKRPSKVHFPRTKKCKYGRRRSPPHTLSQTTNKTVLVCRGDCGGNGISFEVKHQTAILSVAK